jgi:SAM-dependent methyltransferase
VSWKDGIGFELKFWEQWIRTRGSEWPDEFAARLNPDQPVPRHLFAVMDAMAADPVQVLDVGAGPLTNLGRKHPRKQVVITATDALADEYNALLDQYGIEPPVRTIRVDAEGLAGHFPANSFDLVHARNSIDHCYSPLEAVRAMVTVAKPGAPIHLYHFENEAEHGDYVGFHQWNFTVVDGDFMVQSPGGTINVTRELASVAQCQAHCEKRWVTVIFRKHPPTAATGAELRRPGAG